VSRPGVWIAGGMLVVALLAGFLMAIRASSASGSIESRAALQYAASQMSWQSTPTVKLVQNGRIANLSSMLLRHVPEAVATGVNVPDLKRLYGAQTPITLVVLQGSYNSLPPDEGITSNSDVISIVRRGTRHVLLLTA
jgi:hypothetical protein